jgi:antitoxin CptB
MSEKSRVRWLCRRGMKELDVLLERFMAVEYDRLDGTEQAAFVALLANEDPDLYALIMAWMPPADAVQAGLLERIRAYARPASP